MGHMSDNKMWVMSMTIKDGIRIQQQHMVHGCDNEIWVIGYGYKIQVIGLTIKSGS